MLEDVFRKNYTSEKRSNLFLIIVIAISCLILSGCIFGTSTFESANPPVVQSVSISSNVVTINGSNFKNILKVEVEGITNSFDIISLNDNQIQATTSTALELTAKTAYNLVLKTALAQTVAPITLILDSLGAADGQVLRYDSASGWQPAGSVYVTSTGLVGIGTATPSASLEILGSTDDSTATSLNVTNNSGSSFLSVRNDGKININTQSNSTNLEILGYSNLNTYMKNTVPTGSPYLEIGDGTNGLRIGHQNNSGSANYGWISYGSNTAIVVKSDGTVGMGTSNTTVNVTGIASAKPFVVAKSDSNTTVNGSSATIVISNTDTTAQNNSALAFATLPGSSATNHFVSSEIVGIHLSRGTSTDFPAGELAFLTTQGGSGIFPSERMRIDKDGDVGIGTTSPAYKLDVTGDIRITGTPYRDGGDIAWSVPSDERLKNITSEYTYGLSEITKLKTIKFRYKENNPKGIDSSKEYIGVIAQEVQKQIPEAVQEDKDGFLSLNTTSIFWAMINSIKELYAKWFKDSENIHREIAEIKEKLEKLEKLEKENSKIKEENVQLQRLCK